MEHEGHVVAKSKEAAERVVRVRRQPAGTTTYAMGARLLLPTARGKWVAVDLHGTLCCHDKEVAKTDKHHVGVPILAMVERVKSWLAAGIEVRIFTAKIFPLWKVEPGVPYLEYIVSGHDQVARLRNEAIPAAERILAWCKEHLGEELVITCVKDRDCREIWDDKAVPVEKDTGRLLYNGEREFT